MTKRVERDEKISIPVTIPKSLHTELTIAAARQGREIAELMEDALQTYLLNGLLANAH